MTSTYGGPPTRPLLGIRTVDPGPPAPPVVEVQGEVDVMTAPELRRALHAAIDDGAHDLVVDLEGTEFLDSCALGVLVGACRRVHAQGGALVLRGLSPTLRHLVRMTALDEVFQVEPGEGVTT